MSEHSIRPDTYFLGGRDLEMETIAGLLRGVPDVVVRDQMLGWGAKASAYHAEIVEALQTNRHLVFVELTNDLPPDLVPADRATWIDHHNEAAGEEQPTALARMFGRLSYPTERWTRDLDLVAANDRGHIDAMVAINASAEEIRDVRQRDRDAQRVTDADMATGREAIAYAESHFDGRLTVVRLPHAHAAVVTDQLHTRLGGRGYENLLIISPNETSFFGDGRIVTALAATHVGGWRGGAMPRRGFWGLDRALDPDALVRLIAPLIYRPAAEIEVKTFHHVLLWPVLLRGNQDGPFEHFVKAFEDAGWEECGRSSASVPPDHSYEEVVYFHPLVRDFLFGDGVEPYQERTIRRFKRKAAHRIDGVKIRIDFALDSVDPSIDVTLRAERVELLLIRPHVALFVVELSNRALNSHGEPAVYNPATGSHVPRTRLNLDQVLHLQNRVRQIFPAFFEERSAWHGDCVRSLEWVGRGGPLAPAPGYSTEAQRNTFDEFAHLGAELPVYDHWQLLFGQEIRPIKTASDRTGTGLFFQQQLDNRMPGLSFVCVDNPAEIHPDDRDRFPAFDPPGLDYDPTFRAGQRERFRYSRFSHYGTTYYCNGTSFVQICNATVGNDGTCFSNYLLQHFRRHYTNIALIAQYQHAALLNFDYELYEASKQLAGRDAEKRDRPWRERIRRIQHRLLKFRGRSFFTQVSNQVQGKELFELWYRELGTEALFERVTSTSEAVHKAVESYELMELSKSQEQLARLATFFLPINVVISLLTVLYASDFLPKYFTRQDDTTGPFDWHNIWNAPHVLWIGLGAGITLSVLIGSFLWRRFGSK